ncbi:MAG: hypothetical protein RI894_1927 [Bacteroidota bacterium]|jgi:CubicO group peptidase (beta-lactamase class C family)
MQFISISMLISMLISKKVEIFLLTILFWLSFSATMHAQSSLYFPPLVGTAWQTIAPASLGWCPDKVDSLHNYLGDHHTKACIILKDGKIAAEWYYGNFTQDSVHYWASAGKTITGLLVGVAQQEGLLAINDTTSRYLGSGWTSLSPAKERLITLKHNLTMTTGLDDGVPDDNCTLPSCLIYKTDAGTRWAYYNASYRLLQDVVANASNMTYQQYTTSRLKQKTGMTGLWYDYIYYSTARSMARFGLLLLNKGIWNTTAVLSDTAYFNAIINTSNAYNLSYGYLTWLNGKASCMVPQSQLVFSQSLIPSAPADMFCALGKNDQKVYVVPSQHLVVIRLGEAATNQALALSAFDEPLWQKINDLVCSTSTNIEQASKTNIAIFPNPAQDILNLKSTEPIENIALYNDLGQLLITEQVSSLFEKKLDITSLYKGIYFIVVQAKNKTERLKWVKE